MDTAKSSAQGHSHPNSNPGLLKTHSPVPFALGYSRFLILHHGETPSSVYRVPYCVSLPKATPYLPFFIRLSLLLCWIKILQVFPVTGSNTVVPTLKCFSTNFSVSEGLTLDYAGVKYNQAQIHSSFSALFQESKQHLSRKRVYFPAKRRV